MAEEVTPTPPVESPAEPPTTPDPENDVTTWKNRLRGKDAALTTSQRERDEARAEADRLRQKVTERETADLSEVQRAQRERDEARAEAEQAKREARAATLGRTYPLAADVLGDLISQTDESRLAEIEARLKGTPQPELEPPEPRVDPNQPRRQPPVPDDRPKKYEDLKAAFLKAAEIDNSGLLSRN